MFYTAKFGLSFSKICNRMNRKMCFVFFSQSFHHVQKQSRAHFNCCGTGRSLTSTSNWPVQPKERKAIKSYNFGSLSAKYANAGATNLSSLILSHQIRRFSCWSCQASIQPQQSEPKQTTKYAFPLKCPKCSCLQPQPKGSPLPNYFEILGLGPGPGGPNINSNYKYKVDLRKLSEEAKRLQRQLHPDLFTQKDKVERELSDNLSSLVNKAIRTLQDPIERGQYLLLLKGFEVDLEKEKILNPEFLGEVMELNERLEELASAQQWKDFRDENEAKLLELEKKLEIAFDQDDTKKAQLLLNKMKFFESLQSRLKLVQLKFGVVD